MGPVRRYTSQPDVVVVMLVIVVVVVVVVVEPRGVS